MYSELIGFPDTRERNSDAAAATEAFSPSGILLPLLDVTGRVICGAEWGATWDRSTRGAGVRGC